MSLVLCYCEKCGHINAISSRELDNIKEEKCVSCDNVGYYNIVPQDYLTDGKLAIKIELNDKFVENIVKSSPNFDQECWDRRVGYQETRKHYDEILRNEMKEKNNIPKCPTCQSTNLKKITVTSKAMNTALFGLLGTKRHKTFHCNSCGYEW